MALRFRCAKCGKRLTVDQAPGEEVTCLHCGQATVVPTGAKVVSGAAAGAAAASPSGEKAEGEEEEEQEETGMDTMMGWLALYLPSWGTSVVLHAAIIILAIFIAWQRFESQLPFEYTSAVYAETKRETQKRPQQQKQKDDEPSRGRMEPRPSSIVKSMTNPFPDVASNQLEVLEVIGVGGGGREIGGFEGLGTGSGRGSGLFGVGGEEARKIVYVVDRSGSMTDSIDYVKFELKRCVNELTDEKEFHVIFYSSGPPVEMPTRRLINASDNNKRLAFEFVDGIIAHGQTDPSAALENAFRVKPEVVYLLTDGEFDRAIIDLVKRLNVGGKVTVHTIGFLYDTGEAVLKEIAKQNGGNYKFVSERDLATLVQ